MLCAEFISIHLPVGVGQIRKEIPLRRAIFQSTHPVRGGTKSPARFRPAMQISIHPPRAGLDCSCRYYVPGYTDFNPPTPCGVGLPAVSAENQAGKYFNPPTPCGVGRARVAALILPLTFQSTHPVRGGTQTNHQKYKNTAISIHPPRAGWDPAGIQIRRITKYFNPPTPCGVGP